MTFIHWMLLFATREFTFVSFSWVNKVHFIRTPWIITYLSNRNVKTLQLSSYHRTHWFYIWWKCTLVSGQNYVHSYFYYWVTFHTKYTQYNCDMYLSEWYDDLGIWTRHQHTKLARCSTKCIRKIETRVRDWVNILLDIGVSIS